MSQEPRFDWRSEGYVCASLHRVAIAGCKDCDKEAHIQKQIAKLLRKNI